MITNIRIKNFKKFEDITIELGDRVVFIGPNNSGKTSALQALAIWSFGMTEWLAKKSGKNLKKRTGVTLNRRDLIPVPLPETIYLWKDKHVKKSYMIGEKQQNENIRIDIVVEGITNGKKWEYGLEFDYANREAIYCRPIDDKADINIAETQVAFLPPMSGLSAIEPKWESGRINVLLGEGQTAQVLRNLCYQIYESMVYWQELNDYLIKLFGSSLEPPEFIKARGEITMNYKDQNGTVLDLSCSGRGFQQTVLLLAYLYTNPGTVLLLDEPDAHLEILRQRQIYQILGDIAQKQGSQIIAASHSEVVLKEAADKDMVIAFVGKPHRIDDRGTQVLKSLREIGFDHYYLAEQTGWVLYLEGSTDLAILQSFAKKIGHKAFKYLERPFVEYISNQPSSAEKHFYGLKDAKKDLMAVAIYDNISQSLNERKDFRQVCWRKREIENYFINKDVLISYARSGLNIDLFGSSEANRREKIMLESIKEIEEALMKLKKPSPWSDEVKITDDFLDNLFDNYFEKLGSQNVLRKTNYYTLLDFFDIKKTDPEIIEKLDVILEIASKANPAKEL